jgi:hypothetical protein
MGAIPFAITLLSSLPQLIKAGMDVTSLIQDSMAKMKTMEEEKRDPTPQEWDALNAQIDALRKELHS